MHTHMYPTPGFNMRLQSHRERGILGMTATFSTLTVKWDKTRSTVGGSFNRIQMTVKILNLKCSHMIWWVSKVFRAVEVLNKTLGDRILMFRWLWLTLLSSSFSTHGNWTWVCAELWESKPCLQTHHLKGELLPNWRNENPAMRTLSSRDVREGAGKSSTHRA